MTWERYGAGFKIQVQFLTNCHQVICFVGHATMQMYYNTLLISHLVWQAVLGALTIN